MKASAGRALARALPLLILVPLLGGCAAYHRWQSRPAPPYPRMTPGVAYEIMRRQSQDKSVPMVEIAREILRTEPGYEERERKPAKS